MAIWGIGAFKDGKTDISSEFISKELAGVCWDQETAPSLFQLIQSMNVGDIVYIKSNSPKSSNITVRGIGIIKNDSIYKSRSLDANIVIGRNVKWFFTGEDAFPKPKDKYNVRLNTVYQEFNPTIQEWIIDKLYYKK